jgi:hypothetical protein
MGGSGMNDILALAASSAQQQPQPGAGMTTMGPAPLAMPSPLPQVNKPIPPAMPQQNTFASVGARKRYDRHQLMNQIAQMVRGGSDYIQAKKNRALENDITRLMQAQEGIQQAKATLQQDPNNQDAQKAIKQNTGIINDITTDPKKAKMIQKAFDIDLFGSKGGKNKNEQAALASAMTKWQQDKQQADKSGQTQPLNPIAQRLMGQQPMVQQLTQQAQQTAAAIKAGLIPDANHQSTESWQNLKTYSEAKTKEAEIASRDKIADDMVKARLAGQEKQYQASVSRYLSNEKIAEANRVARVKVAQIQAAEWDKRIDILRKNSSNNPVLKSLYNDANSLNTEMKTLTQENEKNQAELDKLRPGILGSMFGVKASSNAKMMQNKIDINNLRLQTLQGQLNEVRGKMMNLNQMGLLAPNPEPNTPNDTPLNTEPDANQDPENLFPK